MQNNEMGSHHIIHISFLDIKNAKDYKETAFPNIFKVFTPYLKVFSPATFYNSHGPRLFMFQFCALQCLNRSSAQTRAQANSYDHVE